MARRYSGRRGGTSRRATSTRRTYRGRSTGRRARPTARRSATQRIVIQVTGAPAATPAAFMTATPPPRGRQF